MEPPDPPAVPRRTAGRDRTAVGEKDTAGASGSAPPPRAPPQPPAQRDRVEAARQQALEADTGSAGRRRRKGLLAIVYSEFDNTLGPTIRFQAPEGFLSQELFDGISDYVITGRQLYGRVVAVATADYQVLGFPLAIENEKYARNTLLFNVSFVLPIHADTTPYEPILRKLALTLHAMEIESEFLFRPEKKQHLGVILARILHDLTSHGECLLTLDEANLLSLKLTSVMREPPTVGDHEVPVFLRDPEVLKALDWDLALRQVIPHIDGVKYAKRIAMDAEMDVDCAKAALRTLVYYDFVALLDIFQFSNVYLTTAYFPEFCHNPSLQAACQRFVATDPAAEPAGLPSIPDILALYGACQPDATLADIFLARRDKMESIDPRRFVTFGVVYGLLRRVHRHPVFLRGAGPTTAASITAALSSAGLLPASTAAAAGATPGQSQSIVFPPSRTSSQSTKPPTGADGPDGALASAVASALQAQQQQQQAQQQHHQALMQPAPVSAQLVLQIQSMMDGTRTADELCVAFLRPYSELEELALLGGGEGAEVCILYK